MRGDRSGALRSTAIAAGFGMAATGFAVGMLASVISPGGDSR